MSSEENRKRLERQARGLMITKEISRQERDKINAIMRDRELAPEARYSTIIRLLRNLPDREISEMTDEPVLKHDETGLERNRFRSMKQKGTAEKKADSYADIPDTRRPFVNGPTET